MLFALSVFISLASSTKKRASGFLEILLPRVFTSTKHVCKNIPYSLALRIRRICSEEESFEERLSELKKMLLHRKYSCKEIDLQFSKVKELSRTDALKSVKREENSRTTFTVTYKPQLPSISNILQKHWHSLIVQNEDMKDVLQQPPMVAYKQPQNLQGMLCKAKIPKKQKTTRAQRHITVGLSKCLKPYCAMCPFINTCPEVKSSNTTEILEMTRKYNCFTRSVICVLTCRKCQAQYVGQTGRHLKDRVAEHVQNIKSRAKTPVGLHFNSPGHSLQELSVQIIEQEKTQSKVRREIRKSYWIKKFKSSINEKP